MSIYSVFLSNCSSSAPCKFLPILLLLPPRASVFQCLAFGCVVRSPLTIAHRTIFNPELTRTSGPLLIAPASESAGVFRGLTYPTELTRWSDVNPPESDIFFSTTLSDVARRRPALPGLSNFFLGGRHSRRWCAHVFILFRSFPFTLC